MTTTGDQDRALAELLKGDSKAACVIDRNTGELFVRIDYDREYLIDRDGTTVPAFYAESL